MTRDGGARAGRGEQAEAPGGGKWPRSDLETPEAPVPPGAQGSPVPRADGARGLRGEVLCSWTQSQRPALRWPCSGAGQRRERGPRGAHRALGREPAEHSGRAADSAPAGRVRGRSCVHWLRGPGPASTKSTTARGRRAGRCRRDPGRTVW